MKNLLTLLTCLLVSFLHLNGQTVLRGKITDENGEALIGATVSPVSNPTQGTITDFDGNFSLKLNGAGSQVIKISYISYQTITDTILADNKVTLQDYIMRPATLDIEVVEVVGKANRSKDIYMEKIKAKSAISIDYISAETIKRTGDSRVDDAVKRITGVSTVGGYISVRGLADRYNKTAINGSRIPTLDPITNNIRLDIFPANLVDNIVVTKTQSPDLPADWAGSFLSIETKDYPEKLMVSISTTVGYNSQSTFKNGVAANRSSSDWMGFDNGYRDIEHPERGNYPTFKSSSDLFSQFEAMEQLYPAMEITGYLAGKGIDREYIDFDGKGLTTSEQNRRIVETKGLALMQMGYLDAAYVTDATRVNSAWSQYQSEHGQEVFRYANADVAAFGTSLSNNWVTTTRKAPLDFSQEMVIGDQLSIFGKPLGFLIGARYATQTRYDAHSNYQRNFSDSGNVENIVLFPVQKNYSQTGVEINGWSALLNLALKVTPNHSISVMFMPNLTGYNRARYIKKYDLYRIENDNSLLYSLNYMQQYEERQQLIYQAKTTHYFPGAGLRVEFDGSYTDGQGNMPDFRRTQIDVYTDSTISFAQNSDDNASRIFDYLDEDILDLRLSLEIPLWEQPGLIRKLKVGGSYQENLRVTKQFVYNPKLNGIAIPENDLTEFFDINKFGFDSLGRLGLYYEKLDDIYSGMTGSLKTTSGYIMTDFNLTPSVRISGGLRMEYFQMHNDFSYFADLGIGPYDSLRSIPPYDVNGTILGTKGLFPPGQKKEVDYLPSVNLIFKLRNTDVNPINLRASYGQSLARPSLRESNDFYNYDYYFEGYVTGDIDLKTVYIYNYDLRFESYFANGDNISVTGFYKNFKNHIEVLTSGSAYSWANSDKSFLYGVELEGKKGLGKRFELRANFSYIYSFTKGIVNRTPDHAMYGQAPYLVNTILNYTFPKIGISGAVSYNIQGPKIVLVSNSNNTIKYPDVYELPRSILDFKLTKTLGKYFGLTLKIRNLLNEPVRWSYDHLDWTYNHTYTTPGTDYSIGISYNL